MVFGNSKKKTVAGITESLTKIKSDLEILDQETADELDKYNVEQMTLQLKIEGAKSEKNKGFTIFKNISALLGETVIEVKKEAV